MPDIPRCFQPARQVTDKSVAKAPLQWQNRRHVAKPPTRGGKLKILLASFFANVAANLPNSLAKPTNEQQAKKPTHPTPQTTHQNTNSTGPTSTTHSAVWRVLCARVWEKRQQTDCSTKTQQLQQIKQGVFTQHQANKRVCLSLFLSVLV